MFHSFELEREDSFAVSAYVIRPRNSEREVRVPLLNATEIRPNGRLFFLKNHLILRI